MRATRYGVARISDYLVEWAGLMIKTLFLLPVRDNEGKRFPRAPQIELRRRLLALGGYTMITDVTGE